MFVVHEKLCNGCMRCIDIQVYKIVKDLSGGQYVKSRIK
jgi:hypothetical protein